MKYTLGSLCALLLFSCGQPQKSPEKTGAKEAPEQTASMTDSVGYTIKTLVKESRLCNPEGKTDTTCKIVDLRYPVFTGDELLNDSLARWLSASDNPDKHYETPEAAASGFIADYETFVKSQKKMPAAMPWELMVQVSVEEQKAGIVPLLVDYYAFMGGAHGNPATFYHNWDSKTHTLLKLKDVLKANYADSLRTVGEKLFRKQEKLSATASLKEAYFFDGGRFAMNDNFLITPQGLKFLYNPYEIKPYAAGKTELLIPYAQIKTLIKKDGPLGRYTGE